MFAHNAGVDLHYRPRLKALMKRENLSQTELSRMTGIQVAQINKWVSGKAKADAHNLLKIAEATKCSPGWLVFGEGEDQFARIRGLVERLRAAVPDAPAPMPEEDQAPAAQPGANTGTPPAGTTPAEAGTAEPVRTARRTRPSRIEPAPEPPATYTPATPDREWTDADLPGLQIGNILTLSGVAAGGARVPEIVKGAYFHENGVRHIVASISGRSMEPRIAAGARVVLEVLKPVLTLVSGEIPESPGVRSGDVYLVELDDGEATLKRLDIFRGVASLRAYNEHEWGVAGVRLLTPGEQIRVLARFVGLYKGKLPA